MNTRPYIRRVTASEAELLSSLHDQCFDDAWSEEFFASLLAQDNIDGFVASADETAAAAAFILVRSAAGEAEILTVGTSPPARRSGIARALVRTGAAQAFANGAAKLMLEVSENNVAACSLYYGLGFSPVGKRAGYYRDSSGVSDAIIVAAPLPLRE